MVSVSLCMIVKNEEKVLERCLSSVQDLVDEIIIVDTGSTDNTKEIAKKFTSLIYDFEWVNDFSAARNFSFSKATKDYQFWLDASDVLEEEDRRNFKEIKDNLIEEIDVVTMNHCTHFDENDAPLYAVVRERLVRRKNDYVWHDPVREHIKLRAEDNIFYADNMFIMHRNDNVAEDRDLSIYDSQIQRGISLSPRAMFSYAKELKGHERYIEAAFYFHEFLSTKSEDPEDNIEACFDLGGCYNALDEKDKALDAFLESFKYHGPRAELCCEIGYHFKDKDDHTNALHWFYVASSLEKPEKAGFMIEDYWGYTPNIELARYYSDLNDIENVKQAIHFNQLAKEHKPDSKTVLHNEHYLITLLNKLETT